MPPSPPLCPRHRSQRHRPTPTPLPGTDADADAAAAADAAADAAEAAPPAAEAAPPAGAAELRRLRVFMGERARAADDHPIGAVDVAARDGEIVEVVLDVDANDVLRVHDVAVHAARDLGRAAIEANLEATETHADADRAHRRAVLEEIGWEEEAFLRAASRLHLVRWAPSAQGALPQPTQAGPNIFDEVDLTVLCRLTVD